MAERISMDYGWRFHLGDVKPRPIRGHDITYLYSKAEHAKDAGARDYDDTSWALVRLPHDYVVEGVPSAAENPDHGSLPRENAWYRKTFKLEEGNKNRRLTLLFDGVASGCRVYINGFLLHTNTTGGTSFEVDFTDVATFGEDVNVVAVYVDNSDFEGWYYEGGGIYRHVWLMRYAKVYTGIWDVFVKSAREGDGLWKVEAQTTVRNALPEGVHAQVITRLLDREKHPVGEVSRDIWLQPKGCETITQRFMLSKPELWDLENPYLYDCETMVRTDGGGTDVNRTRFGIRSIEFSPEKGFLLNGRQVKLKGMSNHQDHSALGVAVPDRVHKYRIDKLKEMGCNSYRCAHNPHAPQLFDYCDEAGVLVMDENRWFDSSPRGICEAAQMVLRDRNHPSIIMWSMYNEEPLLGEPRGRKIMSSLYFSIKALDDTRPVTGAMFFGVTYPGSVDFCDIIGVNYNVNYYGKLEQLYPNKALLGSETACGDTEAGRETWRATKENERVAGTYPWTGIRYRGEARWPNLYSRSGCLDQICNPTDNAWLYRAWWLDTPVVHVSDNWKLGKRDGAQLKVYTNGTEAELLLDGASLGRKAVDPYEMAAWDMPRGNGTLTAIAYKDGARWAEETVLPLGKAARLCLRLENGSVKADGEDVAIVTAYFADASGHAAYGQEDAVVSFSVNACGNIIATGSSSMTDTAKNPTHNRLTDKGCCQAFIRSTGRPGTMTVAAACAGYGFSATLDIPLEPAKVQPHMPYMDNRFIYLWRESPIFREKPDLAEWSRKGVPEEWAERDVGRGSAGTFADLFPTHAMGAEPDEAHRAFTLFQAECTLPWYDAKTQRPVLHFESVQGKGEFLGICGGKTAKGVKDFFRTTPFDLDCKSFAPGEKAAFWVLIEANASNCSLDRSVRWVFEPVC